MNNTFFSQVVSERANIVLFGETPELLKTLEMSFGEGGYGVIPYLAQKEPLWNEQVFIQKYIIRVVILLDEKATNQTSQHFLEILKKSYVLDSVGGLDLIVLPNTNREVVESLKREGLYLRIFRCAENQLPETVPYILAPHGFSRQIEEVVLSRKPAVIVQREQKTENQLSLEEEEREKRIQALFEEQRVDNKKKVVVVSKASQSLHTQPQKNWLKKTMIVVSGLGIVLFILLAGLTIEFFLLTSSLSTAVSSMKDMKYQKADTSFGYAQQHLQILGGVYAMTHPVIQGLMGENVDHQINEMVTTTQDGIEVARSLFRAGQTLQSVYSDVMGGADQSLQHIDTANAAIEDVYKKTSGFISQVQQAKSIQLLSFGKHVSDIGSTMLDVQKQLVGIQQTLGLLPDLFGKNGKKTYAVFFQDTEELRPTGGLLSSMAFITFDGGKLLDVQTQDVSSADALMTGRIAPPQDLQKMLGEQQWLLRDSNWSGDGAQSMQQAKWFVEKAYGRQVDGVVFLTSKGVHEILKSLGEIEIPAYHETLNAQSFQNRLQGHYALSQEQKGQTKTYNTAVFESLLSVATKAKQEVALGIGRAILDDLQSGDLMIWTGNAEIDRVFAQMGWGGVVLTPPCPQQFSQGPCIVDRIYTVEANVGTNGVNPYIQRKAQHQVILNGQTAVHAYVLSITNTTSVPSWPLGEYRSYIRLYVPASTQINTVFIDKVPISPAQLSFGQEGNNKTVGVLVSVPPGKTSVLQIQYVTPLFSSSQDVQSAYAYALFMQKQPGVDTVPTQLEIVLPDAMRVWKVSPNAQFSQHSVLFQTTMESHDFEGVQIGG